MSRLPLLLLVSAALAASPAAGDAQRTKSLPAPQRTADQLRLQRLETLADLWGKLELFHPYVASRDIDWDQGLIAAIPKVEAARSTEEFVAALNESLFRPLGDPLSFARTADQADGLPPHDAVTDGLAGLLAPGVGYLNASYPWMYREPLFPKNIVDAVQQLGSLDLLIVDLRWREKQVMGGGAWLALWADSARTVGMRTSRLHEGFGSRWQVEPGRVFAPLHADEATKRQYAASEPDSLAPIGTPTVFLVNPSSYAALEAEFDALQARRAIAVVLEPGGPFTESWAALTYPEGVRVRLNSPIILSHTGALGSVPDTILHDRIHPADLPELAARVLRRKTERPQSLREAFTYPAWRRPSYEVSEQPLSREERLLGLFKLWNYIGTFNAYQEYASIDWAMLLKEWIPKVEAAPDTRTYYTLLQQITARLNDSHAGVNHPSINPQPWWLPVIFVPAGDQVVAAWVDTALVGGTPIERGDVLLAVDGKSVADIEAHWRTLRSASHEGPLKRDMWLGARALRGEQDSPARLRIRGRTGEREITLTRSFRPTGPLVYLFRDHGTYRELPGGLGYIDLYRLAGRSALDSALVALRHTQGLILDVRRGPMYNGDFRGDLVSRFMTGPVVERKGEIATVYMHGGPPRKAWSEQFTTYYPYENERGIRYTGPVVVLTDALAQSWGESIPWLFKISGRATFVGSPTAGTNGGAPDFQLPGGGYVVFTHERVLNLDGSRYHGIGIVPDVQVEPTAEGIREGRDEVLEKGIEVLRRKIGTPELPID